MICHTKKATLSLVLLLLGTIAGYAHADSVSLENIRVRLPNGQILSLGNRTSWTQDPRIRHYNRYYYHPEDRMYVVYNERRPPAWGRVWNYRHKYNDRRGNDDDRPDLHDNRGNDRGHGRR